MNALSQECIALWLWEATDQPRIILDELDEHDRNVWMNYPDIIILGGGWCDHIRTQLDDWADEWSACGTKRRRT